MGGEGQEGEVGGTEGWRSGNEGWEGQEGEVGGTEGREKWE